MRARVDKSNPFYLDPRFAYGYGFINDGERLLDYGCFTGDFGKKLIQHKDVEYYGVDKNLDVLPEKSDRFQVIGIRDEIPFPDGFFDVATIFEVLEHVHDQDRVVRELRRVLKPGGRLIVSVPKHHIFSFLDVANFKFVFPRTHRLFYTLKHSKEDYRYRYAENPYGLVGDIEKEKSWHQQFTEAEMRDLLTRNGFVIEDLDGAAFFNKVFLIFSVLRFRRFLPQKLWLWDAYRFQSAWLFCTAKRSD